MNKKIIGILVVTLLIVSGFAGASIVKAKNEKSESLTVTSINQKSISANAFQGGWVSVKTYNNYASKGMPDFDQKQDKWQKIVPGQNGAINSAVDPNDILLAGSCIAPGNDGDLDSTPGGDDETEWYYCGSVSSANVLWWLDSKHEKNGYPDNNNDTCNIVTVFPGAADDHAKANVPPFIVSLATGAIGTANACTTTVNMVTNGIQATLNAAGLNYNVKNFQNPTIPQMWNWINNSCGVVLRLDIFPVGGHFVALDGVDNQNNQIGISDSCYDNKVEPNDHTKHNDARIVNHDTYFTNFAGGATQIPNYPSGVAVITDAIVAIPKLVLKLTFGQPHLIVRPIGTTIDEMDLDCYNESTMGINLKYYPPEGIDYVGNATVNGVPYEPLIEGGILNWYFSTMQPGESYHIAFDIMATNPESLELERMARCWGSCPMLSAEVYDDDFGVLEIIDENPPTIENVHHYLDQYTLCITCDVTDDTCVDEVKAIIRDPLGSPTEYEMTKSTGDEYELILDCSEWQPGEYTYHIWSADIADNENESQEYTFLIAEDLTADANGPYESIVGEPIQFYGSVIAGTSPYSWYWDFGDDSTSTEQNPTHAYTAPGNYTVTLTVTDNNDDTAIDTTWALIEENTPPNTPIIDGATSGKAGTEYEYRFSSSDPEGHYVSYYVDWGDGTNSGWIGPYVSGEEVTRTHIWQNRGTYIIQVKARDTLGEESDWAELEVSMPKNKAINPLFLRFLENHPHIFPLLRQLLEL